MPWARLDDGYDEHEKVRRAWHGHPRAVGLHALALAWCSRKRTDGRVDSLWVAEKLPAKKERDRVLEVLVSTGLFDRAEDGTYIVHDFLDYNPSREEDDERREHLARVRGEAGRKGGLAKAANHPPKNQQTPGNTSSKLLGKSSANSSPEPEPHSPLEVGSPADAGDEARATGNGTVSISEGDVGFAEEIKAILQRGVDGLTTSEQVRAPTREAILKVHQQRRPSRDVALAAAIEARSITQSQDRAPNIVGLYGQRLEKAMGVTA